MPTFQEGHGLSGRNTPRSGNGVARFRSNTPGSKQPIRGPQGAAEKKDTGSERDKGSSIFIPPQPIETGEGFFCNGGFTYLRAGKPSPLLTG